MSLRTRLISALAFVLLPFQILSAQDTHQGQEDSLVYLISGKSARSIERDGVNFREIEGPATFLHNNTYLICDTALWNVDAKFIDAIGNVSIIQDQTVLTSDKMKYLIDLNLAQFRGNLVQLTDKDHNTLRTRHLDYNTKDSVAVFREGGSMMDKDGQIIESLTGTYDSKIKVFDFKTHVNMFTDSIFVKTNTLRYEADSSFATFGTGTNAWKDKNMLSAEAGWYDRGREIFFFYKDVHLMSDTQEAWGDSLYFYRTTSDVRLLGNTQVTDTTRHVHSLAGSLEYVDSISKVTLTRNPAVVAETEENGVRDTLYMSADSIYYYVQKMCDIDSLVVAEAALRKSNLEIDPVSEFRRKAAEEAARKAEEEAANDPNRPPQMAPKVPPKAEVEEAPQEMAEEPEEVTAGELVSEDAPQERPEMTPVEPLPVADSLAVADSLGVEMRIAVADSLTARDSLGLVDSLAVGDSLSIVDSIAVADTLALPEPDTTKIGFAVALRNVKIFKKNMQIVCDSLLYSDLDSLARLFKEPIIWNEVTQQFAADSVSAVVKNNAMEKVSLMSNAFIHIQQDSSHYNQIKGTEMLAFFDGEGELSRFDALGGSAALFYIEENDAYATVNKKDSKMLSAIFKDGNISRIYYFDTAVSDAYPVVQMSREDQKLKGFNWMPEKRPQDKSAVTTGELRPSERTRYNSRPRARFTETDRYFPGYIDDIYVQIAVRDSLNHVREKERQQAEKEEEIRQKEIKDSLEQVRLDSLATVRADSLALADSLKAAADSVAVADSLARVDSLVAAAQTAAQNLAKELTKEEIKAAKKAEKEKLKAARQKKKQERIAAREARWAAKDASDEAKAKAKEEKKAARLRQKQQKAVAREKERLEKEVALLQKYIEKYQKKLQRKKARGGAPADSLRVDRTPRFVIPDEVEAGNAGGAE